MSQRHNCISKVSFVAGLEEWIYIRFEGEGDDGLGDGRYHKGPCPLGVWDVHSALATDYGRELCGEAFAVMVSARLGLVRLWWVVAAIKRLASEEGCSCLVVRNFGGMSSRRTAELGDKVDALALTRGNYARLRAGQAGKAWDRS